MSHRCRRLRPPAPIGLRLAALLERRGLAHELGAGGDVYFALPAHLAGRQLGAGLLRCPQGAGGERLRLRFHGGETAPGRLDQALAICDTWNRSWRRPVASVDGEPGGPFQIVLHEELPIDPGTTLATVDAWLGQGVAGAVAFWRWLPGRPAQRVRPGLDGPHWDR
jgi:hypothetical protein